MKRLALLLAFLPPTSATLACNCPEAGSYAELSAASMAKRPRLSASNDAVLECMHTDAQDRCDGVWIVPTGPGVVTVTAHFEDGTTAVDSIEFVHDSDYPCRGTLRPAVEKVIRL